LQPDGEGVGELLLRRRIDAWSKPPDASKKMPRGGVTAARSDVDWQNEIVFPCELEAPRHNSDDRVLHVVQGDVRSEDTRLAAELSAPERIADQHHTFSARSAIVVGESTTERGPNPKHTKQAVGDDETADPLGFEPPASEIELAPCVRLERLEQRVLLLPARDLFRSECGAACASPVAIHDLDETLGMRERRGPQDRLIDDAEDRGGGADPDAEDHDHQHRLARLQPKSPKGEMKIVEYRHDFPLSTQDARYDRHSMRSARITPSNMFSQLKILVAAHFICSHLGSVVPKTVTSDGPVWRLAETR
jgi:hypothetical protein